MRPEVRKQLLDINRHFYETFARSFSASRFAPQPGYERIIRYFPERGHVLDVGCGNARVAHFLDTHGKAVTYLGVDRSAGLLAQAREQSRTLRHVRARFLLLDVGEPGWERVLDRARFDVVLALAVLHHIPGAAVREAFMRGAASLLRPGGYLILSHWRFLYSERMRRKIVPWEEVGLAAKDVDPGDYLLDWKKGGYGYRYVHQVTEEEVDAWARAAGLTVVESFYSDGREGDLSFYQVLTLKGQA
ncbi:MAG: class I SAM-dependent methyltransferase [Chloroflexi bacterium]|nr:class I SAM-dependent methyltransferase [Chloroflexota bacterium]